MGRGLSPKIQARQDQILAVLRDANGFPLSTSAIAKTLGFKQIGHDWNTKRAWCSRCRAHHESPVWRRIDAQDIRGLLNRLAFNGTIEKIVLADYRQHYWRAVRPDDGTPDA